MTALNILAIDPAGTTGFCWSDGTRRHSGTWDLGTRRGFELRRRIFAAVDEWPTDVIVFESAAFGSRNRHTKAMHSELEGVIIACAQELGLKYWCYPPSQWKRIALGEGNADKERIAVLLKRLWGIDLPPGDEADACGILLAAMMEGKPPESKKKMERRVRKAIKKRQPMLFKMR